MHGATALRHSRMEGEQRADSGQTEGRSRGELQTALIEQEMEKPRGEQTLNLDLLDTLTSSSSRLHRELTRQKQVSTDLGELLQKHTKEKDELEDKIQGLRTSIQTKHRKVREDELLESNLQSSQRLINMELGSAEKAKQEQEKKLANLTQTLNEKIEHFQGIYSQLKEEYAGRLIDDSTLELQEQLNVLESQKVELVDEIHSIKVARSSKALEDWKVFKELVIEIAKQQVEFRKDQPKRNTVMNSILKLKAEVNAAKAEIDAAKKEAARAKEIQMQHRQSQMTSTASQSSSNGRNVERVSVKSVAGIRSQSFEQPRVDTPRVRQRFMSNLSLLKLQLPSFGERRLSKSCFKESPPIPESPSREGSVGPLSKSLPTPAINRDASPSLHSPSLKVDVGQDHPPVANKSSLNKEPSSISRDTNQSLSRDATESNNQMFPTFSQNLSKSNTSGSSLIPRSVGNNIEVEFESNKKMTFNTFSQNLSMSYTCGSTVTPRSAGDSAIVEVSTPSTLPPKGGRPSASVSQKEEVFYTPPTSPPKSNVAPSASSADGNIYSTAEARKSYLKSLLPTTPEMIFNRAPRPPKLMSGAPRLDKMTILGTQRVEELEGSPDIITDEQRKDIRWHSSKSADIGSVKIRDPSAAQSLRNDPKNNDFRSAAQDNGTVDVSSGHMEIATSNLGIPEEPQLMDVDVSDGLEGEVCLSSSQGFSPMCEVQVPSEQSHISLDSEKMDSSPGYGSKLINESTSFIRQPSTPVSGNNTLSKASTSASNLDPDHGFSTTATSTRNTPAVFAAIPSISLAETANKGVFSSDGFEALPNRPMYFSSPVSPLSTSSQSSGFPSEYQISDSSKAFYNQSPIYQSENSFMNSTSSFGSGNFSFLGGGSQESSKTVGGALSLFGDPSSPEPSSTVAEQGTTSAVSFSLFGDSESEQNHQSKDNFFNFSFGADANSSENSQNTGGFLASMFNTSSQSSGGGRGAAAGGGGAGFKLF